MSVHNHVLLIWFHVDS